MDSKVEISHDAIDQNCYYLSTEEDEEINNNNTDQEDYNFNCPDHTNFDDDDDWDAVSGKHFTILKEQDIRKRQENDISEVSNVLQVSKQAACLLLLHYNWSVSRVQEEWFTDDEKVRNAVGIFVTDETKVRLSDEFNCGICFEEFTFDCLHCVGCGHFYCNACWNGYISASVNDGLGCLTLRCPEPKCSAAVGRNMVDKLIGNEDKTKYYDFLCRSYVENNPMITWCPAPGCDSAIEFVVDSERYDVVCDCSYEFCWNCKEETHRPVDCETVGKWNTKNSADSENSTWIMVKTKPCPKCKKPIEKNQGCNIMTCRPPCRFRFCWLCLCPISAHGRGGQGNGGPGSWCPILGQGKVADVIDESEKKRLILKKDVEKYNYYYERWVSNNNSRQKVLRDLKSLKNVHLQKLCKVYWKTELQLKFIIEAWEQIAECRSLLKWSYAYGYYLSGTKLSFFEHLQGEAESGLERLHHCAETELIKYIKTNKPSDDINGFRTKLMDLTSVTRNYFDNLVRALENDLSEVISSKVEKRKANETEGPSHKRSKPRRNRSSYMLS